MYHEAVDDAKLKLLAFEDRWHFVAILCCKCQGVLDDQQPELMRRMVAVKLGLDLRELDEVARRLSNVGLLDAESLQPTAWDNRQFLSDSDPTAAERARRYRKNKKKEASRVTSRTRHGCVTGIDTDTEADKDTEQDIKPLSDSASESDPVAVVFAHWQNVMHHPRAKLDDKRRRKIRDRLKDGYTVGDLMQAVDGCKRSPHHMGENDRGAVYDDIELICRDAPHVDKFIKLADGPDISDLSAAGRQTAAAAAEWMEGMA
jgi:hypothetical protein